MPKHVLDILLSDAPGSRLLAGALSPNHFSNANGHN